MLVSRRMIDLKDISTRVGLFSCLEVRESLTLYASCYIFVLFSKSFIVFRFKYISESLEIVY